MKICLVYPNELELPSYFSYATNISTDINETLPPMGLLYIIGNSKYQIDLIDNRIHKYSFEKLAEILMGYDLIGFGGTIFEIKEARRASQYLMKRGKITIYGGSNATVNRNLYLGHFSIILRGEASFYFSISHKTLGINFYLFSPPLIRAVSPFPGLSLKGKVVLYCFLQRIHCQESTVSITLRQPAQGIQNILLANPESLGDALSLNQLGEHTPQSQGSTTAISREASRHHRVTLYPEPYLHGIPTGAGYFTKPVSIPHIPHIPRVQGMVNSYLGINLPHLLPNELFKLFI